MKDLVATRCKPIQTMVGFKSKVYDWLVLNSKKEGLRLVGFKYQKANEWLDSKFHCSYLESRRVPEKRTGGNTVKKRRKLSPCHFRWPHFRWCNFLWSQIPWRHCSTTNVTWTVPYTTPVPKKWVYFVGKIIWKWVMIYEIGS